jgi:hypothetical protein
MSKSQRAATEGTTSSRKVLTRVLVFLVVVVIAWAAVQFFNGDWPPWNPDE